MKKNIILLILLSSNVFSKENRFDKMDERTAISTGIYKLSDKEKVALLVWLEGSEKEIIKKDKLKFMGFFREDSEREEINSSIIGEFNGWKGKTFFKLVNGQTWRQLDSSSYFIPKSNNPDITIKPKSMGSWVLYVKGVKKGVKVKRIK